MKILLSNDDGIDSEGLKLLAETLGKEHEVLWSLLPRQKSAFSHSMTFREAAVRRQNKNERRVKCLRVERHSGRLRKIRRGVFRLQADIVWRAPTRDPI